jgi:hypothetical protein
MARSFAFAEIGQRLTEYKIASFGDREQEQNFLATNGLFRVKF